MCPVNVKSHGIESKWLLLTFSSEKYWISHIQFHTVPPYKLKVKCYVVISCCYFVLSYLLLIVVDVLRVMQIHQLVLLWCFFLFSTAMQKHFNYIKLNWQFIGGCLKVRDLHILEFRDRHAKSKNYKLLCRFRIWHSFCFFNSFYTRISIGSPRLDFHCKAHLS